MRQHFVDNGPIPVGSSPEELAELIRKDIARQAAIAKKIGIQPQ